MPWYFFLIITVAAFTVLNLLQRVIAVDSDNPRATSIIFNLYAAIFTLVINALTGSLSQITFPHLPKAWLVLGISALCYGLYERGRFYVAKAVDASTASLIANIATPVSFIGSILLYQERPQLLNLIGFVLIMISLILATYEKSTGQATLKGIGLGLLINSVVGIGIMLDKLGAELFNPNTFSVLLWTVPLLVILPPPPSIKVLSQTIKAGSWKTPTIAGLNALAYFSLLQAYQTAPATLVIPLSSSTLPTVIIAAILLKERDRLPQKILAALLSILGIFLLVR